MVFGGGVSVSDDQRFTLLPHEVAANSHYIIDEFNTRFEMFATEIADMKDMILKLQSYTMDVNKMLLEERIDILSDVNPNNKTNTVGIDTDLTSVVSLGGNTVNTAHSLDMRELVNSEINKDDE